METKSKSNYIKIILIFSVVSLILLIISPFAIKSTIQKKERLQSRGIQTTAEIISFDWTTTVESEKAIISFSDQEGNVHTMPLGFYSTNMYIGMKVPIIYDPEEPNSIIYVGNNSFFIDYGGSILLITGALISGTIAVATYIKLRRKKIKND